MAFAKATAGGTLSRLAGIVGLAFKFGPSETIRMLRNIAAGRRRKVSSLALETFWSRGAIRWGDTLAVRYLLRPAPGAAAAPQPSETDPDFLSNEFARRLDAGNIRFELCIQRYVDATSTPIEDTAIEWTERASPPVKVAELVIAKPACRHRRGVHQHAGDRRARLQSVEHDRRIPPARQSEPRPQGRL